MTDNAQLGFSMPGLEPVRGTHAIRLELNALIDTARAARDVAPWDADTHRRHRAMFAERARVLPPDEAEFLRRQFVLELDRLEPLLSSAA